MKKVSVADPATEQILISKLGNEKKIPNEKYNFQQIEHDIYNLFILCGMSKKSCPFLYSECSLKIGQDFINIQYSYIRLDVPLMVDSASDPP